VSELGSLMSVDMKTRVIAPHASRKLEKAGYSGILASRAAKLPFMLALAVSFCAVRDVVQPDRRVQPERHRSPGRHQQAPKDERCSGHARSLAAGALKRKITHALSLSELLNELKSREVGRTDADRRRDLLNAISEPMPG